MNFPWGPSLKVMVRVVGAAVSRRLRCLTCNFLKHLKLPKDHFTANFFFTKFGWGTLLSFRCGQMGCLNSKALWMNHLAIVR